MTIARSRSEGRNTPPVAGAPDAPRDEKTEPQSQALPEPDKTEQKAALDPDELHEIRQLKIRDREVRAHEAAHVAAGGSLVRGGTRFDLKRGPDGVLYAVGGEVSIDTSPAATPEATVDKAERIRRAALAPAEPSPQDRSIAARATQMSSQARAEIMRQQRVAGAADEPQLSNNGIRQYQTASLASPEQSNIDDYV